MLNMKRFNPLTFLLSIAVMIIIVIITRTPVANPLKSLEETEALMDRLGLHWDGPGAPVIVFASAGCPASQALEADIQRHGVRYLRVDVYGSDVAKETHADLGRNYLGTVATRATPTIVVGTEVLRGNDVEKVLQAINAQHKTE